MRDFTPEWRAALRASHWSRSGKYAPKRKRVAKTCATCGASYEVPLNRASTSKYCKRACLFAATAKRSVPPKQTPAVIAKRAATVQKRGSLRGPRNGRWKGGVTPYNQMLRASPLYKAWAIMVLKRCWFTCQRCGVKGGRLEAHHILAWAKFTANEYRFDPGNGIALCRPCHKAVDPSYNLPLKRGFHD